MLWIALAASLSAPVPTNLGSWFSNDDFPAYLVEQEPSLLTQAFELVDNSPARVSLVSGHLTKCYALTPTAPSIQDAIVRFSTEQP